jgi:hypothetical protein
MIAGFSCLHQTRRGIFFEHPGCGGDCRIVTTGEKDAEKILKKVFPAGNLLDVKLSPVGGLWQLDIEAEGKRGSLYLDFSRKHMINGQIVPLEALKVNFSKISLTEALVMGPKTATKKIVVFTDPDCPFCKKLHEEMKLVIEKRKDIAFYLILYPLPMHKDAYKRYSPFCAGNRSRSSMTRSLVRHFQSPCAQGTGGKEHSACQRARVQWNANACAGRRDSVQRVSHRRTAFRVD